MQPFVVNRHDRIVFPSNFVPELDLSVMHSLEQLDAVIRRDFEVKAPSGTDILNRVEEGAYSSRYDLMRDLALNLFWTNRFSTETCGSADRCAACGSNACPGPHRPARATPGRWSLDTPTRTDWWGRSAATSR